MARASESKNPTRIQREKTRQIHEAALEVFSTYGYRGSTIDQIASKAGLSKPNLLYYFDNKETIYDLLLIQLLDDWVKPLRHLDANGDPIEEICAYVHRKLEMSRDMPRESRLFANEIIQGAPRISRQIKGDLKELLDDKARVISQWVAEKKIADVDPYHLIFSIWATTQHYADFEVQVKSLIGGSAKKRFQGAETYLDHMFRSTLHPSTT